MGIDHPVIAGKIQAEGQLNEVFPGKYLLRIPGEGCQKLPLDGGNRNRFPLFADLLPVLVDHKITVIPGDTADNRYWRLQRPPPDCLHPGIQIFQAEGLGNIVIRPDIQTIQHICFHGLCREHNDRHPGLFADLNTDFFSGKVGKQQIQDHKRNRFSLKDLQRFPPGFRLKHMAALLFQI